MLKSHIGRQILNLYGLTNKYNEFNKMSGLQSNIPLHFRSHKVLGFLIRGRGVSFEA